VRSTATPLRRGPAFRRKGWECKNNKREGVKWFEKIRKNKLRQTREKGQKPAVQAIAEARGWGQQKKENKMETMRRGGGGR